jgi:hypothetical protein
MGVIAEEESLEKRRKIDSLRLSTAEWDRLSTFTDLLAVSVRNLFHANAHFE